MTCMLMCIMIRHLCIRGWWLGKWQAMLWQFITWFLRVAWPGWWYGRWFDYHIHVADVMDVDMVDDSTNVHMWLMTGLPCCQAPHQQPRGRWHWCWHGCWLDTFAHVADDKAFRQSDTSLTSSCVAHDLDDDDVVADSTISPRGTSSCPAKSWLICPCLRVIWVGGQSADDSSLFPTWLWRFCQHNWTYLSGSVAIGKLTYLPFG